MFFWKRSLPNIPLKINGLLQYTCSQRYFQKIFQTFIEILFNEYHQRFFKEFLQIFIYFMFIIFFWGLFYRFCFMFSGLSRCSSKFTFALKFPRNKFKPSLKEKKKLPRFHFWLKGEHEIIATPKMSCSFSYNV